MPFTKFEQWIVYKFILCAKRQKKLAFLQALVDVLKRKEEKNIDSQGHLHVIKLWH